MNSINADDVKNHFRAAMDVDYVRVNQDLIRKRLAAIEGAAADKPPTVSVPPSPKSSPAAAKVKDDDKKDAAAKK